MKTLRNRTLLTISLLAILFVFTVGVFALGNSSLVAFAHGKENDFDGYTIEDIQDILKGQSSFNLDTS